MTQTQSESETKLDIAKFKDAHARCCYVWLGKNAVPELIAEIERRRAEPSWAEGIEEAAKVAESAISAGERVRSQMAPHSPMAGLDQALQAIVTTTAKGIAANIRSLITQGSGAHRGEVDE